MIQRVQTLWLALAALCMALCFAFPVAHYAMDLPTGQRVEAQLDLVARGDADTLQQLASMEPVVECSQRLTGMATWPLVTLCLLTVAVAAVCIFLFRRRVTQARLVGLAFLVNVGYAFAVFFWAVDKYQALLKATCGGAADPAVSWAAGAFLPLASLVLLFLAQRAIRKDEARVRAADRLRN
ncbi:MAG: DUF4293 domain-containing protein [Bacteroidales bacterium]|nr:DUF4293 domain-containing protein [Bacteroidales bacterium]